MAKFFGIVFSALLVQAAYSQCNCGGGYIQPPQWLPAQASIGEVQVLQSQIPAISSQYQLIQGSNQGLYQEGEQIQIVQNQIPAISSQYQLIQGSSSQGQLQSGLYQAGEQIQVVQSQVPVVSQGIQVSQGIIATPSQFTVLSGSPQYPYPSGVSVNSNNEFGGSLAVSGGLPFAGAAFFDGSVSSNGQAGIAYSSGQGVNLANSGCNVGLAGEYINGYGQSGSGFSSGSSGFGFSSGSGSGFGIGIGSNSGFSSGSSGSGFLIGAGQPSYSTCSCF